MKLIKKKKWKNRFSFPTPHASNTATDEAEEEAEEPEEITDAEEIADAEKTTE